MLEEGSPGLDRPDYKAGTVQGTGEARSNWIFSELNFQWVLVRTKLGQLQYNLNVGMGDL